jgi:hypothetical protein
LLNIWIAKSYALNKEKAGAVKYGKKLAVFYNSPKNLPLSRLMSMLREISRTPSEHTQAAALRSIR